MACPREPFSAYQLGLSARDQLLPPFGCKKKTSKAPWSAYNFHEQINNAWLLNKREKTQDTFVVSHVSLTPHGRMKPREIVRKWVVNGLEICHPPSLCLFPLIPFLYDSFIRSEKSRSSVMMERSINGSILSSWLEYQVRMLLGERKSNRMEIYHHRQSR